MYIYNFYTNPYLFTYNVRGTTSYSSDFMINIRSKVINTSSSKSASGITLSKIGDENFVNNMFDELFPMAVRCHFSSLQHDHYLIERPPFQAKVDYSKNKSYYVRKHDKAIQGKEIWIPWTAMLISVPKKNVSFSNINFSLYFNNSPISSDKDVLINSFFPNSSTGNGAMCVGATLSNISFSEDHPPSIKEIVNIIYNDYFSGGWNADINNLIRYNKAMLPALNRLEQKAEKYYLNSDLPLYKHRLENGLNHIDTYAYQYVDFFYCYSEMTFEEVFEYYSLIKDLYSEPNYNFFTVVEDIYTKSQNNFSFDRSTSYLSNDLASSYSVINNADSANISLFSNYEEININVSITNFDVSNHSFYDLIKHPQIISDAFAFLFNSLNNPDFKNSSEYNSHSILQPYDANLLIPSEKEIHV